MSAGNKTVLLVIIFLLLVLAASLTLVFRTTIFVGQASSPNTSYSVAMENSYLFASPLQAKADSKEQIRITVFLLDGRGLGIPGQQVLLNLPSSISVNSVQPTTDDSGKAVFDLSSPTVNKFELSASTSGKQLHQKLKIVFY